MFQNGHLCLVELRPLGYDADVSLRDWRLPANERKLLGRSDLRIHQGSDLKVVWRPMYIHASDLGGS